MNDTLVSCSHITKRFVSRGRYTDVLCDISLTICAGQVVVIRGRSGAGKTTLLQIMAGLERPSAGRVEIAGRPIEKLGAGELARLRRPCCAKCQPCQRRPCCAKCAARREVSAGAARRETMGFIFQNFNLIQSWTAGQNVEAALIHTKLTGPMRRQWFRLCSPSGSTGSPPGSKGSPP